MIPTSYLNLNIKLSDPGLANMLVYFLTIGID